MTISILWSKDNQNKIRGGILVCVQTLSVRSGCWHVQCRCVTDTVKQWNNHSLKKIHIETTTLTQNWWRGKGSFCQRRRRRRFDGGDGIGASSVAKAVSSRGDGEREGWRGRGAEPLDDHKDVNMWWMSQYGGARWGIDPVENVDVIGVSDWKWSKREVH